MSDNLPHTTVELLAIQPDSVVRDKGQPKKMPLRPPFTVDPDYVAIFRVNITHPKKLGTFNGEITITTSFEKVWHIPVYYKTAVGSLKTIPEKIVFLPTFPVSFHLIYNYHHSTKLYRKISRVCCRLYCYECAARVTVPTATNE